MSPVQPLDVVILGLSITSSWGNGHATTYRALVRALHGRGHRVLFLERDVRWYHSHRDLSNPGYCRAELYANLDDLRERFAEEVRDADLVIVGSYVPEGIEAGEWVLRTATGPTAFYDIDTPVTLAALTRGTCEYLTAEQIPRYDLFLTFNGGPTLDRLERELGSPMARPLYCSVDERLYFPETTEHRWDLGYLGTYSADRQPTLDRLLLDPARRFREGRFAVMGPQYPGDIEWPPNVERRAHLPPAEHRAFYNAQRWTLNVTRSAMIAAGYSPSVRLFEASACGTPILSDGWEGLYTFFRPGEEIIVASTPQDVLACLRDMPDDERLEIGRRARQRVLARHTASHRAAELEQYVAELLTRTTA